MRRAPASIRPARRPWRAGALVSLSAVACTAVVLSSVPSAWAAVDGDAPPTAQLGTLGLGDGLEAMVGEADGSVRFGVTAGGLVLSWDSRAAGVDRYGFGPGWGLDLARVETRGGVRVLPASGGAFPLDTTQPSGLAGYPSADIAFRLAQPGAVLDGRAGVAAVEYAYVLHELGGVRTYFSAAGDPVARTSPDVGRIDWVWAAPGEHRLSAIVGPDGIATALDWSDPAEILVRPGANVTAPPAESGADGGWRVRLDGGRLSRVVDPVGRDTRVGYGPAGLVSRITTAAGASTVLTWHPAVDGVARMSSLRTHDPAGAEYSARHWRALDGVEPSGWPALADGSGPAEGYSAELTDGTTRIVSTYGAHHAMTGRAVLVSTGSGELGVHEQAFELPEPGVLPTPAVAAKPSAVTVTVRNAAGDARSSRESYTYDELGRMVRRDAADGTVAEWEYDRVVPVGAELAVGLPLREATTTRDGIVASTRYELNPERTAPVVIETATTTIDGLEHRTGRTELAYDGAEIAEQRVYPGGDPSAVPVVTTRDHDVDVVTGTRTVVETVAAGTAAASVATVSSLVHGGPLAETNAVGGTRLTRYDAAWRPTASTDPSGQTTTMTYRSAPADGIDVVAATAPDGVTVTEERDVLGRVVRRYDDVAPGGIVSPGHERVFETHAYPAGGVEELTDAWGATTRTERDVFGRVIRITLPNGLVQLTQHDDAAATVTSGASPTGSLETAEHTTTRRLDGAGRLIGTSGSRADGVPVADTSIEYDGLGRKVFEANGAVQTRVTYDPAGNPLETRYPSPAPGAERPRVRHEYDEHGRRSATVDVAGNRTVFGYDRAGALRAAVQTNADGDELARVEYHADDHGRITRVDRGNEVSTELEYSSVDQIVAETTSHRGDVQSARSYEYDPVTGNLTARVDRTRQASGELVAERTEYVYDTRGRLVRSLIRAGGSDVSPEIRSTTYELDVSGAVISETVRDDLNTPEPRDTVRRFGTSAIGEITTVTTSDATGADQVRSQEYDAAGNLVLDADGSAYTWDAANRQRSKVDVDGRVTEATYWADGSRRQLAGADGRTTFYWDGEALLNETHATIGSGDDAEAAGTAEGTASYLLGAHRHARTVDRADGTSSTAYYGVDRHGNVTDLTDADGRVTDRYTYSDYGVPTASRAEPTADPTGLGVIERNPFGYAMEYTHADGSQFLRERTYHPRHMIFSSRDEAQLHSVYGYADANPIMFVDPSGRAAIRDWFAVGFAAYGAVAAALGVFAVATGGVGLGAFGVISTLFGIGDAVYTAVESWAVATDTTFIPEDLSLGIGVGLAVVGTAFGVGGLLKRLTTSPGSARFRAIAMEHLGDGSPPTVRPLEDSQRYRVLPGSSDTGLSPLIRGLVGSTDDGLGGGVRHTLATLADETPLEHGAYRYIREASLSVDSAVNHLADLVRAITATLDGLERRVVLDLKSGGTALQLHVNNTQHAVESATYSLREANKHWLKTNTGSYFTEGVRTPYDDVITELEGIDEGLQALTRYD